MVITEHPAEPFSALDRAVVGSRAAHSKRALVVQPLVSPLAVVVLYVLVDRVSRMPFAENDHPFKALGFDRAHKPLGEGVEVRAPRR